jgi:hypothetical protein
MRFFQEPTKWILRTEIARREIKTTGFLSTRGREDASVFVAVSKRSIVDACWARTSSTLLLPSRSASLS